MENQNAMNKYKSKVDNISFDVARGARARYKRIARESGMRLGEFIITAIEEYIHMHDLDTVDTYEIKPNDSDELLWIESEKCYFPIRPETREKLKRGEISGIKIQDDTVQISGIDWSTLGYKEISVDAGKDESEVIPVGCPIPIIPKKKTGQSHSTDGLIETSENQKVNTQQRMAAWYSIMQNMFSLNDKTNRINYKLDHQPYKVVRNMSTDYVTNVNRSDETQDLSGQNFEDFKASYSDDQPITKKDLFNVLPNVIADALKIYLDKNNN